jgi:hypothetical protein
MSKKNQQKVFSKEENAFIKKMFSTRWFSSNGAELTEKMYKEILINSHKKTKKDNLSC